MLQLAAVEQLQVDEHSSKAGAGGSWLVQCWCCSPVMEGCTNISRRLHQGQ